MNKRAIFLPAHDLWLDPNSKAYELYTLMQQSKGSKPFEEKRKAFEAHIRLLKK